MPELSQWVAGLPVSLALRRITWLIPVLQIIHIMSIGMLLSSVVMIGLRTWGVSQTGTLVERSRRYLPWLWIAVAIATVSGIVLMLGAPRSWRDGAFAAKLLMMAAATVATLVLPLLLRRRKEAGGVAGVVAAVALVLWLGATLAGRGRWIAGMLGG
jgi:cytochrome bd-type quinol oxidase subunit 2